MVLDINNQTTDASISDIAYLTRSGHRVPTLIALTERPRSRAELCELAGVSSSTIRRTLGAFEDRAWVYKEGYQYEATQLGAAIATEVERLLTRLETERKLRDVWHWLPDDIIGLALEASSRLTVTVADPDAPYRPVNRFESLLQGTTTLRFIRPEVALMEPCLDVLFERVEAGVEMTLIDRPSCHAYFLSTYPNRSSEMLKRDNFTVLEHDELPTYGVGLLDEDVIISCYERDSGAVRALLDTNVSAIREWAESVYKSFEEEAKPLAFDPIAG